MKKFRAFIGITVSVLLGIIYCPLLMIAVTDIAGTAKGSAYNITEPELSIYRLFGVTLLGILIVAFIIIEIAIKKYLFEGEKRLSYLSIGIVMLEIISLLPVFN